MQFLRLFCVTGSSTVETGECTAIQAVCTELLGRGEGSRGGASQTQREGGGADL